MNSALLLANAIALAAVLGFHFAPEHTDAVAQRTPHYLRMQKAPQWAVSDDQRDVIVQDVSQSTLTSPSESSERLVF
ncbi:hypothetical protein GIW70_08565 [Pseudomonas syringae]|nr:hypothetical protein [Pseudomonas syringae]MCF5068250.1 hypothetical protein [Pseudomonas syringae]